MKNIAPMTKVISLSLMTALCLNCESANRSNPTNVVTSMASIINGQSVTDDQFQNGGLANSVVAIVAEMDGGEALCTGTLIAQDMVLTAGHCLTGAQAGKVAVVFQAKDLTDAAHPARAVLAKNFLVQKEYADSHLSKDDLALIQLANPAPVNMTPAKLVPPGYDISHSFLQDAIGYGQSDERHNVEPGKDGSGILRWTRLTFEGVLHAAPNIPARMDGMILFDTSKTGVCHGDSGGPLLINNSLVDTTYQVAGVAESVIAIYTGAEEQDYQNAERANKMDDFYKKYPDAPICSGYGLYVSVADHLDWISQTMTALRAQP